MVLHKELRVCNWNLMVLIVEDNLEVARGKARDLVSKCRDGSLPKDAFVKSVDVMTHTDVGLGRFKSVVLANELSQNVPYLVIKVKQKVKDSKDCDISDDDFDDNE